MSDSSHISDDWRSGRGRRVIIAVAGGFGRELAVYAQEAGYLVSGFLHDLAAHPRSLDGIELPGPVLGPAEDYDPREGELVAIGLGDVTPRRALAARLAARGARFATIVHPSAWVAPDAVLGEGTVLAPFAFVGRGARVGRCGLLNTHASVAHDGLVGDGCVLAPYATTNGWVTLGDDVFLGTHAVVTPRRSVGAGSSLSAGAVAFSDVPAGCVYAGNPAVLRRPADDGGDSLASLTEAA